MDNLGIHVDSELYTDQKKIESSYTQTEDIGKNLDEFVEKVRRIPIRGIIDERKVPG